MTNIRRMTAIGLMSGTSVDGVDAALVETDGVDVFDNAVAITRHYRPELKEEIIALLGNETHQNEEKLNRANLLFTLFNGDTVLELLEKAGKKIEDIDVIGFHGHTLFHSPLLKVTRQLGNPQLLANELGVKVVSRFRNVDVKSGGQGAPLEAAYLVAITRDMEKPLGIINIGGIANVTAIGQNGEIQAFHTGPGNAIINDWMRKKHAIEMDFDGLEAARGNPDMRVVDDLLKDEFFAKIPPKSVDRNYFSFALHEVDGLSVSDGAATLTYFVAAAIKQALDNYLFIKPVKWVAYGGGANNPTLLRFIAKVLKSEVVKADELGWNGNTLEAQSFAFLAVRSLCGMPITYPETTGAPEPLSGGKLFYPFEGKDGE